MSSPNISVSPAHAIGARKGTEYVRRAPRGAEQVMVPFPDAWLRSRATRVRRLSPAPMTATTDPRTLSHTRRDAICETAPARGTARRPPGGRAGR
jgi:hypothetical protein